MSNSFKSGGLNLMDDVLVSICCITYNHENYIKDALDGFLMQRTDFEFEILIHDDASTDRTAEIIKEYELKHPDLIKPIYQIENQHSKGVKVGSFNRDRAKGKYLAICEGDDYWIDPYKLQKQFDYMNANPDCLMCVHASHNVNVGKEIVGEIRPYNRNTVIPPEDIILTSGNFIPTSSYFYKAEDLRDRPYFCQLSPVGDYALNLLCVSLGSIHYLDEFMSSYRINVPGSYLYRTARASEEKKVDLVKRRIRMLEEFNKFSGFEFDKYVQEKIEDLHFSIHLLQKDLSIIKTNYRNKYGLLGSRAKASLYVRKYLPKAYGLWRQIRDN
jgi:glycosyltransferase involved in cell wall biosynthesis